jgi:hypothetical protein
VNWVGDCLDDIVYLRNWVVVEMYLHSANSEVGKHGDTNCLDEVVYLREGLDDDIYLQNGVVDEMYLQGGLTVQVGDLVDGLHRRNAEVGRCVREDSSVR